MKSCAGTVWAGPAIAPRAAWLALALCISASAPARGAVEGRQCNLEPTEMAIVYGDLVRCAIETPDDLDVFHFEGTIGASVSLHVARLSGAGTPCMALIDPEGNPFYPAYGCGGPGFIDQKLNKAGVWTIRVEDMDNDQTVQYALALEQVSPPSMDARLIQHNQTLRDEINGVGDLDLFAFEGASGTAVRIQPARVSGIGTPCTTLFRPNGTASPSFCVTTPINASLNQTGTHTIRVEDQGHDQTVTYSLTLACVAGPCPVPDPQPNSPVACFSTKSSGTGQTFMKSCFSNRGNLVRFESPSGAEHLGIEAHGEGYALCRGTSRAFDAGYVAGGFDAPTITQPNGPNTFPLTIERETADGVFRLTQVFQRDDSENDITITMTVTNLSASSVANVQLSRYFDGDIDKSYVNDRYARSLDSVWGWDDASGHGLMLSTLPTAVLHTTGIEAFSNWNALGGGGRAAFCEPGGPTPSVPGDYVGRLNYSLGTINAGASRSVKLMYRRF